MIGIRNSVYMKGKTTWRGGEAEGCRRDLREGVSHGAQSMYFTVFVTMFDILQISMWT